LSVDHTTEELCQISALVERLARESHTQTSHYLESMRLEHEFGIRIGRRTTQVIRFSVTALVILGVALVGLIITLIYHMSNITQRMNEMSGHMGNVVTTVQRMDYKMGIINGQLGTLNGQMNHMTRDVNNISAPMRMMPFRP